MPENSSTDGILKAEGEFTLYPNFWQKLGEEFRNALSTPALLKILNSTLTKIGDLDWYDVRDYKLDTARTDEKITEFSQEGNILIPITLDGTAQIKFKSTSGHSFELSEYDPLKLKFDTLFLTHTAQSGKTLRLLIGKGEWELPKKVIQPVDIQAQLRKVVASTSTALGANGVYTGDSFDALNYPKLTLLVFADQASAADGLEIQESTDGVNWDYSNQYSVAANTAQVESVDISGRYVRIKYTNGAVAQGTFRLMVLAKVI